MNCVEPRLISLVPEDAFDLPVLLDRAVVKRFVVGLARVDTDWAWLVDLERL